MKIGILYICTGQYTMFWDEFYLSCEKYFLPTEDRHYFVFTDGEIPTFDNPNVNVVFQQKLGWPFDTLKRFQMFLGVEDQLSEMDYVFFFNANMIVMKEIGAEILPSDDEELSVVLHPSFHSEKNADIFTSYDRNPESNAYIPYGEGVYCVQGGLNGGTSEKYLKMVRELNRRTEDDLSRDVIALWHDESHLNKYILDKKVKILHSGYICPEGWEVPFEIFMMTRDKKRYGGAKSLRSDKNSIVSFFKKLFTK